MPSKIISETRKLASRNKEKKRNMDMNEAFEMLQSTFSAIPFITRKKKVPKVKMLRLAIKYIRHLNAIIQGGYHKPSPLCPPRPIELEDFVNVAVEEFNERNSYGNRLHEDAEYCELVEGKLQSRCSSIDPSEVASSRRLPPSSSSSLLSSGCTSSSFAPPPLPDQSFSSGDSTVFSPMQPFFRAAKQEEAADSSGQSRFRSA